MGKELQIDIQNINGINIAIIVSENIEIYNAQQALELMMTCAYQGSRKIIIYEKNITPDFFSLSTGIAGEILQKIVNYDFWIAIVGEYDKFSSKSLKDFIYESNKGGRVFFANSIQEGIDRLSK